MSTHRALQVFFVVVALLGVGLLCWAIVRLDLPAQKLAINPARDQPPHQIPGAAKEQEPEPPLPQRLIAVQPVPKQMDWPAGRPVVRLGTDLFLHGEPINALTFSRDGRSLVSVSGFNSLPISRSGRFNFNVSQHSRVAWDVASGRELSRTLWNPEGWVIVGTDGARTFHVVRSTNPNRPALTVQLYEGLEPLPKISYLVKLPEPDEDVIDVILSPDHRFLASIQKEAILLWDAQSGKEIRTIFDDEVFFGQALFTPDSQQLIVGCTEHTVCIWDLKGDAGPRRFAGSGHPIGAMAVSPDGKHLVLIGQIPESPVSSSRWPNKFESAVELWDVTRGRRLHDIPLKWTHIPFDTLVNVQLAFLDNQTFLVVEGLKRQVAHFDVTTGKQRSLLPLNANTDGIVAVSPDGTTIATCTTGGRIVLYDARTAKPIDLPETHLPPVESLAFSGDGKTITTIAGDEIRRWDSDTGKPRETFTLGCNWQFYRQIVVVLSKTGLFWSINRPRRS